MSFAVNYHKWIVSEFRPLLGKRLVEVGAGTGSLSELLLQELPERLDIIEPSEMFEYLEPNLSQIETAAQVNFHQAIFADARDRIAERGQPDSIIYVNVMEHIEDDRNELAMIYDTLETGGRCFIFVPALDFLYGAFDRRIGHFRRYTRKDLTEKCEAAGFRVVKSKYMDLPGILPWWVKYKILKSDSLESKSVELYDKIAVPIISKIESLFAPRIGKNVLIVAEK